MRQRLSQRANRRILRTASHMERPRSRKAKMVLAWRDVVRRAFRVIEDPAKLKKITKNLGFQLQEDGKILMYPLNAIGIVDTSKKPTTYKSIFSAVDQCERIKDSSQANIDQNKQVLELVASAWASEGSKRATHVDSLYRFVESKKRVRRSDKKELNRLLHDYMFAVPNKEVDDSDEQVAESAKKAIYENLEKAIEYEQKIVDEQEKRRRNLMAVRNYMQKNEDSGQAELMKFFNSLM